MEKVWEAEKKRNVHGRQKIKRKKWVRENKENMNKKMHETGIIDNKGIRDKR